jgi:serine/threonine protein kinase
MADNSTTPSAADRNLLFGILALQMDFISRDALIAAMHAWVLDKAKPLGQILREQGHLDPEHLSLLEAMVQAHIRAHHNDPQQSLASLASASSVRQELSSVADGDLQASLSRAGAAHDRAGRHFTGLSTTQLARVDEVCDRFEAAWKTAASTGQRPRMEDYLGDPAAPEHAILLCELAVLDIGYRRLAGENPSVAEYQARFPDLDTARFAAMLASRGAGEPGSTMDTYQSGQRQSGQGLRYRILRPHAKGGLGEVFVAEDQELHREVALKEIQEERAHDAVSRGRFLLEAEITGGLEHPGIVPVYGLGQYADGRPFYAMRFIKGDNLKEAICRFHAAEHPGRDPGERSLALRQLLRRFVDVCNAVAYAHSRGVLHRDLKPGNVMVGKYGETLVVDWGLAKAIGRSELTRTTEESTLQPSSGSNWAATVMGTVIGTPAYMSPEQAAGRLDLLGPASDIYSLGATLYALLTGTVPFEDGDVGAVLQRVQRGEWTPPLKVKPDTSAALDAICRKAMALRPEDRYPSPNALADDIERWLGDESVSAHRESFLERMRRFCRRRPLLAMWLTCGALLIPSYIQMWLSKLVDLKPSGQPTLTVLLGHSNHGFRLLAVGGLSMIVGGLSMFLLMLGQVTAMGTLIGLFGVALGAMTGTFIRPGTREQLARCVRAGGKIGIVAGCIIGYLVFWVLSKYWWEIQRMLRFNPNSRNQYGSRWQIIELCVALSGPTLGFLVGALGKTPRATRIWRAFRGAIIGGILGTAIAGSYESCQMLPSVRQSSIRLATEQRTSARQTPREEKPQASLVPRLRLFENMKDPVGCRQTAELWEKLNRTDADSLCTAACMCAVTATVLRAADPSRAGAKQADAEAEQAIAWLKQAVAAGYKDAAHMEKDTDLDALRDREDFKKLLAELKAGLAKQK